MNAAAPSSGASSTAVLSAVWPAGSRRASAAPARRRAAGDASPTPRNSTVHGRAPSLITDCAVSPARPVRSPQPITSAALTPR